ncbi:MAG: hypothetical protein LC104_15130 [Bacteroidales bacterium]|nr:hypothetical protein [Bacteroidales bacterium]
MFTRPPRESDFTPPRAGLTPRSRWTITACAVLMLLAGCKSKGSNGGLMRGLGMGGGSSGSLTSRGDPLLGGARIPPQNLPIPNRGDSAQSRDPLLSPGIPTGKATPTERTDRGGAAKDKDKEQASIRRDDPFRPGRAQTAAALAGRTIPPDNLLAIGSRDPAITPASGTDGVSPFQLPGDGASGVRIAAGEVAAALRNLGATVEPPERTTEGYIIRVTVPIGKPGADGRPGLIRQYEGFGPTAAQAAADALTQIRGDVGNR